MIRRVFRGRSPYGLLSYLYGQGRRNEHANPHLVASWDGDPAALEPGLDAVRGTPTVGPLTRLLEQPVRGCDRLPERWVYHLVLRNDPGDRRLNDDEWAQVCAAAMDRTGIAPEDDTAACRWVAIRHAADHIHLVATLAREDGRVPRVWNDYAHLAEVAHEFERAFGLRSTAGRDDHTAASRPGVKEQQAAEQAGRRVPPRVEVRRKVRVAAAASAGFDEFTKRLAAQGITVWPRMSDLHPGQLTGYSVSLDGHCNAAGQPVRFGGGKLAPDLSWSALRARWSDVARSRTCLSATQVRLRTQPTGGPILGSEASQQAWREAEAVVRSAAARIRSDARECPDAAADSAWAVGDVLAAAAAVVEGERSGPLTDAADAFARAGCEQHRRIPVRGEVGVALRFAARTIGRCAGGTHPSGGLGTVTIALGCLVAAVAELRTTQRRLCQAESAREAGERLAVAVSGRLSPHPLVGRPRTAAQEASLAFDERFRAVSPGWTTPESPGPSMGRPGDCRGVQRGRI